MALLIYPQWFKVTFEPSPDNYSIVVVITSDTNGKPYFQYDETPILSDDQSSIQVPRHALPRGGYHIVAYLMRWVDNQLTLVDGTDTIILAN